MGPKRTIILVIIYLAKLAARSTVGTGVTGRSGSSRLLGPFLPCVRPLPVRLAPQHYLFRDAEHFADGVVHPLGVRLARYVGRRQGLHAFTVAHSDNGWSLQISYGEFKAETATSWWPGALADA